MKNSSVSMLNMQNIEREYILICRTSSVSMLNMKDIKCEYAKYEGYQEGVYRI
jgi:hypothetical protein